MVIYSAHQDSMITIIHQLKMSTMLYPEHLAALNIEIYGPKDPSIASSPDNHLARVTYFGE